MSRIPEWAKYSLQCADHDRDLWNVVDLYRRKVLTKVPLADTELFYLLVEEGATGEEAATMTRAARRAANTRETT